MAAINLKDLLLEQKLKGVERKAISYARRQGKSKTAARNLAKANLHEWLRRDIIGLELSWSDSNPIGDGGTSGLPAVKSHNPSLLVRPGVEASFQDPEYRAWMVEQEFTWEVDVELWYRLPNNKTKSHRIDPVYFVQRGRMKDSQDDLSAINARIEREILRSRMVNEQRPEGDKNKGVFEQAKYKVTCVDV